MRCPKCGYISFDYNQVCPKCNKDITDEQAKMNIPSFIPEPPALLGILIGESGASNADFHVGRSSAADTSAMDINFGDSGALMSADSLVMDEGQDFEINLESEESEDFGTPADQGDQSLSVGSDFEIGEEEEDLSLGMDEITFGDSPDIDDALEEDDESMDIELDLGDISLEEPADDMHEDGEPSLDLEDLSLDKSITLEGAGEEAIPEPEDGMDAFSMESETLNEDGSEIEIGLDDLKVNETGQLEISSFQSPEQETGESFALGDLEMEGIPSDKEGSQPEDINLGEIDFEDSAESMDVNEFSIDDAVTDDDFAELEGLAFEEDGATDDEKGRTLVESPSMDETDLEDLISDDLMIDNDMGIEESAKGNGDKDEIEMTDDLTIDFDDLEFDLDDSEDK